MRSPVDRGRSRGLLNDPPQLDMGARRRARHRAPPNQLDMLFHQSIGWLGLSLGLLNIYPSLFPWKAAGDRLTGVAICLLLAALGLRVGHLVSTHEMDGPLALILASLLTLVALAVVLNV
jgi:hypothetical protein